VTFLCQRAWRRHAEGHAAAARVDRPLHFRGGHFPMHQGAAPSGQRADTGGLPSSRVKDGAVAPAGSGRTDRGMLAPLSGVLSLHRGTAQRCASLRHGQARVMVERQPHVRDNDPPASHRWGCHVKGDAGVTRRRSPCCTPWVSMSRLARRLTTILPAMPLAEAFEMTRIHRVASLPGAVRTNVMSCAEKVD